MKHRYCIRGNTAFLRETIEIIDTELTPALASIGSEDSDSPFANVAALKINQTPTASALATIALTVGTWFALKFADKAFDAIFNETLKGATESLAKKVLTLIRKTKNEAIEYQSLVYLEDKNLSILVRIIIKTTDDTTNISNTIYNTYKIAYDKIRTSGKLAEIHCYTVVDGCCNLEPTLLNDINEVKPDYQVNRMNVIKVNRI